jgi:hypothetical protein
MWNYTEEDWLKEIKRSLKTELEPVFKKKISGDGAISPFSKMSPHSSLQANTVTGNDFLVIQNFSDMKKAGLGEWVGQSDVGLRFRQMEDLNEFAKDSQLKGKHAFLSQPFPFMFDESLREDVGPALKNIGALNLGWSPLSFGLTRGEILKRPFANWENIFHQEEIHRDGVTWFYLSSAPYQWAGAEPHVELSIILSLAYDILKELDSIKLPVDLVRRKISFGLSLGTDILVESAKITALKVLWDRLGELVSDQPLEKSADVYVLPSLRNFSGRDPWNNVMRLTLMSFAALAGGAQGFKCIPFDVLNQHKTLDAIRISTNIPLLLKREGFLGNVANPFDGNSLFDNSVNSLCASAWAHFQEIERKGGIFEAVRSGWLQTEIKRSCEISQTSMNYREKELIGINRFVSRNPQYLKDQASQLVKLNDIIDPLFLKKSDDDYLSVEPLVISSLGYDWERMQTLSDRYLFLKGERPFVSVVKGRGPVVEKKLIWLTTLLQLGGMDLRVLSNDEIADIESHQNLVIILPGSDEAEGEMVAALKARGAEKVWSTAAPRSGLGIDRYIDPQVNSLDFIDSVHRLRVEVL